MRTFVLIAAVSLPLAVIAAERGHSVSGSAPLGATGAAPLGGVGSLIHSSVAGAGSRSGTYRGGYSANPYTNAFSGQRRYPNQYQGYSYNRRGHTYGVVAPFFYGFGYANPYYSDYSDDSLAGLPNQDPVDTPADPASQHLAMQEDLLGQEIDQLNSEISAMKEQSRQAEPPVPYRALPQEGEEPVNPPTPPVTVVLNDGRKFQSSNFAVVNDTFWDFSKSPARRVAMMEVNVPASVKASAADGAEFPASSPDQ